MGKIPSKAHFPLKMDEHGYLKRNVFERLYNTPTKSFRQLVHDRDIVDPSKHAVFSRDPRSRSYTPMRPRQLTPSFDSASLSSRPRGVTRERHVLDLSTTSSTPNEKIRPKRSPTSIASPPTPKEVVGSKVSKAKPQQQQRNRPLWKPRHVTPMRHTPRKSSPRSQSTPPQRPILEAPVVPRRSEKKRGVKPRLRGRQPNHRDDSSSISINSSNNMKPRQVASVEESTAASSAIMPALQDAIYVQIPDSTTMNRIFSKIDVEKKGALKITELELAISEAFPDMAHQELALMSYQALESNLTGIVTRQDFPYFLHFIMYFNNLWDEFIFFDEDEELTISKGEFLPVAEKLGIFDDVEVAFSKLKANQADFVLFDDFCDLCAKQCAARSPALVEAPYMDQLAKVFYATEIPSKEEAKSLFKQMDSAGMGTIVVKEYEDAFSSFSHKATLAFRAYQTLDKKAELNTTEFHFFIMYLFYFKNLFDEFVFVDETEDLRISKDEFTPVAEATNLFEDCHAVFEKLNKRKDGFVLFDDFCAFCAGRKMEMMG